MIRHLSRKFLLAGAALGSATWSVSSGTITPDVYQAVVLGTVGAYIVGNVSQKTVDKFAELRSGNKAEATP